MRKIEGYDFDKGIDYQKILSSYASSGLQASNLAEAIGIVNLMIKDKAKIYLSYTSNMASSGVRDIIRWLVKKKKVHVLTTSAGGIEEDIMKCLGKFEIGDFEYDPGKEYDKEVNMIGNIKVKDGLYMKLEKFVNGALKELYAEQKKGELITPSKLIWKLGEKINDKKSICYWAWKNKIKIYCPAITDGALGSMIYFFQHRHGDFVIDIVEDNKELNDSTVALKKSGVLCLGGSFPKHMLLMAQIFRNGADYAVFINTGLEAEGSDSGAGVKEAITWGKLKKNVKGVKVFADASLVFPLLVAESFARK